MTLLVEWAVQPLSAALVLWALSLVTLVALLVRAGRGAGVAGGRGASSRSIALALGANAIAGALLWTLATPLAANALLAPIETRRTGAPGCETGPVTAIVVPGADMDAWTPETDPWRVLGPDTLARTLAAAALAARHPEATLHTLGGGDNGRALGALMREVLLDRGVAASRVRVETASRSTRDNALALRALVEPGAAPRGTPIRLVTSALHLRRATASFERAGYAVCGTGIGSLVSPSAGLPGALPWTRSLARTGEAVRELVATLAYARR